MNLPESDHVDISKLSSVFSDTTNSYKFYWFLAILDSLSETGEAQISMRDLSIRMVATVWYPLDYYKLSFGKQDGFKQIAHHVSQVLTVDNSQKAPNLFNQLQNRVAGKELDQIFRQVRSLLNFVPYRFLRPFFANETKGLPDYQVNAKILQFANQSEVAPYRFVGDYIKIHDCWIEYFKKHQIILRGFVNWNLVRFLQKHNPNVNGLTEKLEKPYERDLKAAGRFWRQYLLDNPGLRCIYSGQEINRQNLSLDHFLPWSFVAHDLLWNIVPTSKSVNSAKSDWLPSIDLYFDGFAHLQYSGLKFFMGKGNTKVLEDYHLLFSDTLTEVEKQSYPEFKERLARQILPQVQTAQNLGFSYPFIYNPN
jgi:hypothetical protein